MEVNSRQLGNTGKPMISTEDVSKIKMNYSLSANEVRGLTAAIRVTTNDRKNFEPYLREKLTVKSHALDRFFDVQKLSFIRKSNTQKAEFVENLVYCNNVNGLIEYVKDVRQMNEVHLKFGIDGGGGFLNVCLTIQPVDEDDKENRRQSYGEGVAAKKFKYSGVKKLLLIGLAEFSQENYDNVERLWSILKIQEFQDATIATDLKLGNILVGLMAHSSCFPCTWCTAERDSLDMCGTYRSIGDCKRYYEAWQRSGGRDKDAKLYKNCIHPPICSTNAGENIIDIIPPCELHLLIGVVNHVYKNMHDGECKEESLKGAEKCNVSQDVFHGAPSFAGNACKTLLNRVDILRASGNIARLKFSKCLEDFRKVVHSCFTVSLDPKFVEYISEFKKSYSDLKIRITPKVHAVFFHVPNFCLKYQRGLGFYGEQSIESVHSDFTKCWSKYSRTKNHTEYGNNLLKAVREYNSEHV